MIKLHYRGLNIDLALSCLNVFAASRQRTRFAKEVGGQLFARIEVDTIHVEVATRVRGRHSRFAFTPNRHAEQREIDELFAKGLHYVGDWHTHPERIPTPSVGDLHKITEIFRESKHQLPLMLMVIVGQDEAPNGLFVGIVNGADVSRIELRIDGESA